MSVCLIVVREIIVLLLNRQTTLLRVLCQFNREARTEKHSKAVHRVEEEKFRFPLKETEIEISILPSVRPRQSLCLTPL